MRWFSVGLFSFLVGSARHGQADDRYVVVTGDARERGRQLGKQVGAKVKQLVAHKLAIQYPTEALKDGYRKLANRSLSAIEKYAPTAYEEIMGAAESGEVSLEEMLLMVATYEGESLVLTEKYAGRLGPGDGPGGIGWKTDGPCSGFVGIAKGGHTLMGQTSDEDPISYLNGTLDFVLHYQGKTPLKGVDVMTYVHPGQLATMGFNSHGLGILWQLIDDGSRSKDFYGVPYTALIREALSKPTLDEALEYMCSTPIVIPNNFILAQGNRFVDAELSPPSGCVSIQHVGNARDNYFVHTNHILYDLDMIDGGDDFRDWTTTAGEGGWTPTNTEVRYKALREKIARVFEDESFGLDAMMDIYNNMPLYRDNTLATIFFDTKTRIWQIRFSNPVGQNPPRGFHYRKFSFGHGHLGSEEAELA